MNIFKRVGKYDNEPKTVLGFGFVLVLF